MLSKSHYIQSWLQDGIFRDKRIPIPGIDINQKIPKIPKPRDRDRDMETSKESRKISSTNSQKSLNPGDGDLDLKIPKKFGFEQFLDHWDFYSRASGFFIFEIFRGFFFRGMRSTKSHL